MPSSRLSFRLHLFPSASTCFLHSHLLEHDALGVRCPGERLLPLGAEVRLLVVLVGPELRAAVRLELAPGSETARLAAMLMNGGFECGVLGEERVWFFVFLAPRIKRLDRCKRAVVARGAKEGGEGWQKRGNGCPRIDGGSKAAAPPIASFRRQFVVCSLFSPRHLLCCAHRGR